MNLVSPLKHVLTNIRDFKQSLIQDVFTPPLAEENSPYNSVGILEHLRNPIKETSINNHGGAVTQYDNGFVNFQPSLSDPLRPDVKITTSGRTSAGKGGNYFKSPPEFTPINTAVVGQIVSHQQTRKQFLRHLFAN